MKKWGILFSVFLVLIFFTFFVIATEHDIVCDEGDVDCKVDKAYSCLNEKIDDKTCDGLSSEERIFSLLSTGKCKDEVVDDSRYKSDLRFTSQALIGLHNFGFNTDGDEAEEWLLSQKRVSEGIDWFLEIESLEQTTCTVDSSGSSNVVIGEDKKISSLTGGSCLSLAQGGYWLKINSNCYSENFTISCDKQFLTTLLYQKQGAETIYVSEKTSSASAGGSTEEKVNSFCFREGGFCDYEGSLWASLALSISGNEITFYLPYLATLAKDNENFLPESFLYFLTGNTDFKNQLLSKQINNRWWLSLNDKYYGTALALYPFRYEEPQQKTDSIDWLLDEVQNEDGCWDSGNIRSTGFILSSLWPRESLSSGGDTGGGGTSGVDCEASGFHCSSIINCDADILSSYSCSGSFVCCSQEKIIETCFEQRGEICNSNQNCAGIGSVTVGASDLFLGQLCCVSGSCQEVSTGGGDTDVSSCESFGGTCRVNGCFDEEKEDFDLTCDFSTDVCCVSETEPEKTSSLLWVWILLGLIVLVVLGIIFRDKLRPLWFRIKSGFGKGRRGPRRPPPGMHPMPLRGFRRRMPRRITPVNQKLSKKIPKKSQSEIDDVLKKLKDMGK